MSKWIKKGDEVVVISGNDKGRRGNVLHIDGERVVVQGINIRKKHAKRRSETQTATIIDKEVAIHISNVSLSVDGNPIKLNVRKTDGGAKELFYKQDNKEIVFRTFKASAKKST